MGGDDDSTALAGELTYQRLEAPGGGHVKPREGLVEQQQPGVLDQAAGDQHPLALAAGEIAEGVPSPLRYADPLERPQRGLAVTVARPPPPGETGEGAHQGDIERRDREIKAGALRLGDGGSAPLDLDRPAHRAKLAEQDSEQRRLPAPVGAEKGDALPRLDLEGDVFDRGPATVAGGELPGPSEYAHAQGFGSD